MSQEALWPSILNPQPLYSSGRLADYGDKRLCNKRPGPGGGTRRLHHKPSFGWVSVGAKQDRRTCKDCSFARYGSAVIGLIVQVPTITKWYSLPN